MRTLLLTADSPEALRVTLRNQDGSGKVHVPIAVAAESLDAGLTAGGDGPSSVTRADLQQMVDNFSRWPGPVPIRSQYHLAFEDSDGPSPGFIEKVWLKGDTLWAEIFLTPYLFYEVASGYWRGFSIEALQDPVLPTVTLEGWALSGGTFTNRPALDVNFAAPTGSAYSATAALSLTLVPGRSTKEAAQMDELAKAKARVEELEAQVLALKAKVEEQSGEKDSGELARVSDLLAKAHVEIGRLSLEVRKVKDSGVKERVLAAIGSAVQDRRADPSEFEGHAADPVAWLEKSPYAGIDGLEAALKARKPQPQEIIAGSGAAGNPGNGAPNGKDSEGARARVMAKARELSASKSLPLGKALQLALDQSLEDKALLSEVFTGQAK